MCRDALTWFTVIDKNTGKEPDLSSIAMEDWAYNLVYCDIDGFYIDAYSNLILADTCGNYVVCPDDRFYIVFNNYNDEGASSDEEAANDITYKCATTSNDDEAFNDDICYTCSHMCNIRRKYYGCTMLKCVEYEKGAPLKDEFEHCKGDD